MRFCCDWGFCWGSESGFLILSQIPMISKTWMI